MPPLHKHFFVHCKNWIHPNWSCWNTAHKRITVGGPDGHKVANEKCAEAFREILLDNQCWGLVVRDGGRDPPQQEQDELQWAKLRFLLLQEWGRKFSSLCWGRNTWLPMALMPTQACPMCSHISRVKERAPSQLQLLLCAALLSAAVRVSPRGSCCTLKLTSEAHGSAALSPADVGLGSVLVSVAICYYLGISPSLGLWWNKCTWFYSGNQE